MRGLLARDKNSRPFFFVFRFWVRAAMRGVRASAGGSTHSIVVMFARCSASKRGAKIVALGACGDARGRATAGRSTHSIVVVFARCSASKREVKIVAMRGVPLAPRGESFFFVFLGRVKTG